jgi:hypothetical protein
MTKIIRVSRMISKATTKKAINKLLYQPKKIKKEKQLDWTVPKKERDNHIKRTWTTGT